MSPTHPLPWRAGFWQRLLASLIDALLIGLIIALIGTLGFAMTGGRVQMEPFALTLTSCSPVATIPIGLSPAPPDESNFAMMCEAGSIPGLPMMRSLVVGRDVKSPGHDTKVSRGYLVGADDSLNTAYDLSWIAWIGFLAYLAATLRQTGKTLGMHLLGIHMLARKRPDELGVPLRLLVIRFVVMIGGLLPAIILVGLAINVLTKAPESESGSAMILLGVILGSSWMLWNSILIARKRDPIFDRVAGLAVVRAEAK